METIKSDKEKNGQKPKNKNKKKERQRDEDGGIGRFGYCFWLPIESGKPGL
jgi:hypothetical protein